MGPGAPTSLRLFVAVYPPAHAVDRLRTRVARLGLPDNSRPTPPEQVHLTLVFLGDRSAKALDDVQESVRRSCAGLAPFALTPEALISLPRRRTPHLVAAQTDAPPTLLELQRRLATRLAAHDRNRRPYTPHITLLRFARAARATPIDEPLDPAPFVVERVSLVRSVLTPEGAIHRELLGVTPV